MQICKYMYIILMIASENKHKGIELSIQVEAFITSVRQKDHISKLP